MKNSLRQVSAGIVFGVCEQKSTSKTIITINTPSGTTGETTRISDVFINQPQEAANFAKEVLKRFPNDPVAPEILKNINAN